MHELCKGKPNCKVGAYTSSKSITFIATSLLVSLSSLQARTAYELRCCYFILSEVATV